MINVQFNPAATTLWARWVSRCERATRTHVNLRSNGLPSKVSAPLYKRRKDVFLQYFYGKCAYCETLLTPSQHGDLDHYRPKDAVSDEHDQIINVLDQDGNERPHPGYYWLAYDWHNLLLTCVRCNQPSWDSGKLIGKGTRFPVQGFRAQTEGQEAQENPLLISPVLDDPSTHIKVDASTGILIGKTPQGHMTINLLGLNGRDLPGQRRESYLNAQARLEFLAAQLLAEAGVPAKEGQSEARDYVSRIQQGDTAYAVAAREALHDWRHRKGL